MPQRIGWSFNVEVASGPKLERSRALDVDAYDAIKVKIEKSTTDSEVQLLPGQAEAVKFLAITADSYEELSYSPIKGATNENKIRLDQPLVLAGTEAVGLLSKTLTSLFFTNVSATDDATVEVLIGRNATPAPTS